jgi:hypothetical protein
MKWKTTVMESESDSLVNKSGKTKTTILYDYTTTIRTSRSKRQSDSSV